MAKRINLKDYMFNETVSLQSIGNIFYMNKELFVIPSYQRAYEWTEKEVYELLNDIITNMSMGIDYHIGTVLISTYDKFESAIIDGQQRMLTIMFILNALMEYTECDVFKKNLYRYTNILKDRGEDFISTKIISSEREDISNPEMVSKILSYLEKHNVTEQKFSEYLLDSVSLSLHNIKFVGETPLEVVEYFCLNRFITMNKKGLRLIDEEVASAEKYFFKIEAELFNLKVPRTEF